jgi:hypothetical protein
MKQKLIELAKEYGFESKILYGKPYKHSANEIADILNIDGASAYVRISEIKKQAIKKLVDNVDANQVIDYL